MIGREISHYLILEKIGEGGMGVIYLAEDLTLGRKVALKFLPQKYLSRRKARERFKREARAAATLNHQNIVTIYEIEEYEEFIYIVMEFIEGENLAKKFMIDNEDFIEESPPSPPISAGEIIDIALKICQGLQQAHQAGIVHRDIKLENILATPEGGIKILDFGLARLRGSSRLTEDSVALGTAFYMSPEQLRGEEFDHRTDIWSLGVVLYAMATGSLPFRGKTALETMQAIVGKDAGPASRLNPGIPRGLDQIIKRCMKKKAADRYQDLKDIIADLKRVKENLDAGKTKNQERIIALTDEFRRYVPRLVVSLAILLFFLILTFVFPTTTRKVKNYLGIHQIPGIRQMALLPFDIKGIDSPDNRAFCNGMAESVTRKMICCEYFEKCLMVVPFHKIMARKVTTIQDARQNFGVNLVFHVTIRYEAEWYYFSLELYDTRDGLKLDSLSFKKHISSLVDLQTEFVGYVAQLLEIPLKKESRQRLQCGRATKSGAYINYLKAMGYLLDKKRLDFIQRAIELLEESTKTNFDFALAYAGLGEAYYDKYLLGNPGDTADIEKAKKSCSIALDLDDGMSCVYISLGRIYRELKDHDKSIEYFTKALELDPISNEGHRDLARVYQDRGEHERAQRLFEFVAKQRKCDAGAYNNLGFFYFERGEWEKALGAFEKVVQLNPEYYRGLANLGATYYKLDNRDKARAMFERSLEIKPTYAAFSNLGTIYYYQGLYDHAIQMFSGALEKKSDEHLILGYMAESYYQTQREKSYDYFRRALELVEKEMQRQSNNPELMNDRAFYLGRLGKRDQALDQLGKLDIHSDLPGKLLFYIALSYEYIGERDLAIDWLDRALKKGYPPDKIREHPGLNGLPGDSRYLELLDSKNEAPSPGQLMDN